MDNFLWLEDLYSEKSLKWVGEQNKKTKGFFQRHPHFQKYFEEAKQFHSHEESLPFRYIHNDFVYHLEVTEKNPLGRWVRASVHDFTQEQIPWELLLDLDQLSKEEGRQWYYSASFMSPSGERAVLALSDKGHDRSVKREFDLKTKRFVEGGFLIPESKAAFAWFDEDHILVGGYNDKGKNHLGYPRDLSLWKRGEPLSQARLIFEGKFENQGVWAGNLDERKCLIYHSLTWDEHELYLFDSFLQMKQLHLPKYAREVGLIEDQVVFYLHRDFTSYKAGSVLQVSLEQALAGNHQDHFQVIWQDSAEAFSDGIYPTKESLMIFVLKNVSHELWQYRREGGAWKATQVGLAAPSSVTGIDEDKKTGRIYVTSENFLTPRSLSALRADGSLQVIKKAKESFTGDYTVVQNWTVSRDGTRVPYFVIHKKDLRLDGTNATLLNAYGGFSHARLPTYMPAVGKLWLEKGGVFVLANIRGGSEFGMNWHRSAVLENKQRSYDDFIAVAEDLISRRYTSAEKLGIRGGSNGGLLMGAVTTQRPDLFKAVLCEVPLLDMIRYVELPPGASWMDEYGDPHDAKMREVILKYSPYQNVRENKKYPRIFFLTSITDDRVHPSHARRMAAKMLEQGHEIFFYEESEGGHGSGDLKTKAFLEAMRFSYLWTMLANAGL